MSDSPPKKHSGQSERAARRGSGVVNLIEGTTERRARGQRVSVAIGGGVGGVGRSLLAANLALYLARQARRVMLVDLDPVGPALHNFLGVSLPVPTPSDHLAKPAHKLTRLSGTQLSLCGPLRSHIGQPSDTLRQQILEDAYTASADILVFDLGRAHDELSMDVYLDADVAITVSTPQPAAMEQAYAFLRAALFRCLLNGNNDAGQVIRYVLKTPQGEAMPTVDALIDLVKRTRRADWDSVREAMSDFAPSIVVNRCQTRADREMLRGMVMGLRRRWGIDVIPLGLLDEDDVACQATRWRRPLLSTYPGSGITAGIEQIGMTVANLVRLEVPLR